MQLIALHSHVRSLEAVRMYAIDDGVANYTTEPLKKLRLYNKSVQPSKSMFLLTGFNLKLVLEPETPPLEPS